MIPRTIESILPGNRVIDDGDMLLWRALPLHSRASLGPFVFMTTTGITVGAASAIHHIRMRD